jgi:hypothetical protein
MLADACSLELPSSGPGVDAFDASVALGEAGTTLHGEDEIKQAERDAESGAARDAALESRAAHEAGPLAPIADAASDAPGCMLAGRYALHVVFDVAWVGTQFASIVPIISNGEGELSFDVLLDLNARRDGLDGRFRACAAEVPEFVATLSGERYQAHFAEAVWDARTMPTFAISLRTACSDPGCHVDGEPLYTLLGAELPAASAAWPMDVSQAAWPDHDGDGVPGIAVTMRGHESGPYAYPPLDLLSLRRVQDLSLGLRVVVGLDGALDGCDALHGVTREGSVETRAVACRATSSTSSPAECEPRELAFLNQNLPIWTVRQGSFQAKRLPVDADCQAVRRAFARRGGP